MKRKTNIRLTMKRLIKSGKHLISLMNKKREEKRYNQLVSGMEKRTSLENLWTLEVIKGYYDQFITI